MCPLVLLVAGLLAAPLALSVPPIQMTSGTISEPLTAEHETPKTKTLTAEGAEDAEEK